MIIVPMDYKFSRLSRPSEEHPMRPRTPHCSSRETCAPCDHTQHDAKEVDRRLGPVRLRIAGDMQAQFTLSRYRGGQSRAWAHAVAIMIRAIRLVQVPAGGDESGAGPRLRAAPRSCPTVRPDVPSADRRVFESPQSLPRSRQSPTHPTQVADGLRSMCADPRLRTICADTAFARPPTAPLFALFLSVMLLRPGAPTRAPACLGTDSVGHRGVPN